MSDACRSCKAPIRWIRMVGSGKANPLDLEPAANGNVAIREDGRGEQLNRQEAESARATGASLFLSHFATCPDRKQWAASQLMLTPEATRGFMDGAR